MLTLKDTQQVTYTIKITDKKGQPAPVDGVPQWASSNEAVATVEPASDGMSCVVKGGVSGEATISVQADADLGSGVTALAGTDDVTVVPDAAQTIALTPSDPSDQ